MVEHLTLNQLVVGSSPTRLTKHLGRSINATSYFCVPSQLFIDHNLGHGGNTAQPNEHFAPSLGWVVDALLNMGNAGIADLVDAIEIGVQLAHGFVVEFIMHVFPHAAKPLTPVEGVIETKEQIA